jgi:hypothetical protein
VVCDVWHDRRHLHGLTGRQFLNTDDDLIIGCPCRGLKQLPKAVLLDILRTERSTHDGDFVRNDARTPEATRPDSGRAAGGGLTCVMTPSPH